MTGKTLEELTAWPKCEDEVTVDGMLRYIGAEAQRTLLERQTVAMRDMKTPKQIQLYTAQVLVTINSVALMHAIRVIRDLDPALAEALVKDHWEMCEAGDSFGEYLWDWTKAAGLDPELIKLDDPAQPAK